jgi:hypothetical protein
MKFTGCKTLVSLLLLLGSPWPSFAAAGSGAPLGSRPVDFRTDDPQGERLARTILAKEIAYAEGGWPGSLQLRTAWVKLSASKSPTFLVMYGCSATGNCGLAGFEHGRRGWRQVLDSDARDCAILRSSHGGRRDLSASMHGSATESTVKTYWWRGNRYVRVSEREVVFDR